ncbi:hypothetical protein BpHYR1_020424, partial [Brachionus plicatilis]
KEKYKEKIKLKLICFSSKDNRATENKLVIINSSNFHAQLVFIHPKCLLKPASFTIRYHQNKLPNLLAILKF